VPPRTRAALAIRAIHAADSLTENKFLQKDRFLRTAGGGLFYLSAGGGLFI
jgi:hypothetical protein